MLDASLIVVGSGIKFISHLTTEAKAHIESADKVLYLVNEPAMKEWLQRTNANAESLDDLYTKHPLRIDSYAAITAYILDCLKKPQHVCVVIYGHPCVFALPALEAAKKARQAGYCAKILPGISSEDCLFADLMIDPASHGCLSLEATDVLIYQRTIDPSCHVVLWQVSVIGLLQHAKDHDNARGLAVLQTYLLRYYPGDHSCTLYSAAIYPGLEPSITSFLLQDLATMSISRTATLYIPPLIKQDYAHDMLSALNIDLKDLLTQTG